MARWRISAWGGIGTILVCGQLAWGWGWPPHEQITQAAIQAVGEGDPLARELGPEMPKLVVYCLMPDKATDLLSDGATLYYTNDYLLFPELPSNTRHIMPMVAQTYAPHWNRALAALRTESPANASRWVGSLIHFVEDGGAPPHAAGIGGGPLHSKTENWVEGSAIHVEGYQPQLLGNTDQEAAAGFLKRMEGLNTFSKDRFAKMRASADANDRKAVEPLVLESALESSRVVADVLHTLGYLAQRPIDRPQERATLQGHVHSSAAPGLDAVPAKIMLAGTSYSTLADAEGNYVLRNLPAGEYRVAATRTGNSLGTAKVTLKGGQVRQEDLTLSSDTVAGNLVRNGNFALHWAQATRPDEWVQRDEKFGTVTEKVWSSEPMPVQAGKVYRLTASWKPQAQGSIVVRWAGKDVALQPGQESVLLPAAEKDARVRVLIRTAMSADEVCQQVSLVQEPPAPVR